MRSWWHWIATQDTSQPWAIIGKGPTFDRRHEIDWTEYRTIGLNHVVREHPVQVAHVIDLDVIGQCSPSVWFDNCDVVVMPWHPHMIFQPTSKCLADLAFECNVLHDLAYAGRLLWYNLSTGARHGHYLTSPVVGVTYFSAEAALTLLAGAGVDRVRTIGIDGGNLYSQAFADLKPLTNSQPTFDVQLTELERIAKLYSMDLGSLLE